MTPGKSIIHNGRAASVLWPSARCAPSCVLCALWPHLKSRHRRSSITTVMVLTTILLLFFFFVVPAGLSAGESGDFRYEELSEDTESTASLSCLGEAASMQQGNTGTLALGQTAQYYSPCQLISPIPLTYLASDKKGAPSAGTKSTKPVFSLGRFVTLSVGTFPFAYFYTNFVFDIAKFAISGFDTTYAPWPFNSDSSSTVTTSENFVRLGVSAGLCLAVGVLDIFLPHDW